MWERWQAAAGPGGVTALITKRMDEHPDIAGRLLATLDRAIDAEEKLAEAQQRLAELSGANVDLEREIAMWKARAERVEHPIVLARAQRPSVRPVEISSDKPIASIMPVTGTQFPRQLTDWQRRQLKPKGVDKKGKKP